MAKLRMAFTVGNTNRDSFFGGEGGFGWMKENKKSASPKKNCAYSLQDISCSSTVAVGACNGWSRCREWTQHLVGAQYFAPAHLMRCLIVGCAGMDMPSIRCCAIWGGQVFVLFHTSKAHLAARKKNHEFPSTETLSPLSPRAL